MTGGCLRFRVQRHIDSKLAESSMVMTTISMADADEDSSDTDESFCERCADPIRHLDSFCDRPPNAMRQDQLALRRWVHGRRGRHLCVATAYVFGDICGERFSSGSYYYSNSRARSMSVDSFSACCVAIGMGECMWFEPAQGGWSPRGPRSPGFVSPLLRCLRRGQRSGVLRSINPLSQLSAAIVEEATA